MAAAAPGGTPGFSLPRARKIAALLAAAFAASGAAGRLRIASWNVTNYASGRVETLQIPICAVNVANGLSMAPHVLIAQELLSADWLANFLAALDDAPGSPGDWAAAPWGPC